MTYGVFVEGLDISAVSDKYSEAQITKAALQAINKTADSIRAEAARRIAKEINVPAGYLTPNGGRLVVASRATGGKLEATIRARTRPTSLARYVVGNPKPGARGGVVVQVRPGQPRELKQAFLMRLKAGNADLDTKSNLGLAVRLKPGESLRNRITARRVASGLYLLYGPSVDQVFLSNAGKGVADDLVNPAAERLEAEFTRLLEL